MAFLFRGIKKYNRWLVLHDLDWLPAREIPADPLFDFETQANELSVWAVEENKSNLEQVAAAFALARDRIDDLGYTLFDEQILAHLDIEAKPSDGESLIEAVNGYHRDLIQLSATKIARLATMVVLTGEPDEILRKRILQIVDEAIRTGILDEAKLKLKHKEQLDKFRVDQ